MIIMIRRYPHSKLEKNIAKAKATRTLTDERYRISSVIIVSDKLYSRGLAGKMRQNNTRNAAARELQTDAVIHIRFERLN